MSQIVQLFRSDAVIPGCAKETTSKEDEDALKLTTKVHVLCI